MGILSRVMGIAFLIFFPFPIKPVLAENLLIVEVQIAGELSSNDFIKIYNPSDNNLDISGYKLRKKTSTGSESLIRVFPKGSKILAKGYFLWANSKENFNLMIGADVWSTATLTKNNSLALLNPENVILDALAWGESQNPFSEGNPFPENPEPNQKIKRKKIGQIYQDTNNNANDFELSPSSKPKAEVPLKEPQSETQIEPQPKPLEEPKPIIYPSEIIINEILPSPTGPDEIEEWIEIFNQNSFEVDLSDWKIEDVSGKITTFVFPKGTKIGARAFLVFFRPITKITLNNDGDGLNLIWPEGKVVDSVNYEKAPRGQSYNRVDSKWVWSSILTPGSLNIIPTQETEKTKPFKEVEKIDINTAPAEDLIKIVHIGEGRAQELISLRPFYSLDELTRISGISPKRLEDIKRQGLAWVDPKLEPPKIEKEVESFEKGLAAVAEPFHQDQDKQSFKSFLPLLIALAIAIFSGIIILILKIKLKKVSQD